MRGLVFGFLLTTFRFNRWKSDVRELVDRVLQDKIRNKLVGKCTDDPTLRACWLLQRQRPA